MARLTSILALLPLAAAGPIAVRQDAPSCSSASTTNFEWKVSDFDYHASYVFTTPAHQNSWGYVNFTLNNPALPYAAQCSATSNQLSDFFYGTVQYNCTFPDGTTPRPGDATFDFNHASGLLNVNQTWGCSDLDPTYP